MKKCKVPECEENHSAKGYCSKHYGQIKNHGRLAPELERKYIDPTKACTIEGCNEPQNCIEGLCKRHQIQKKKNGKITMCAVIGCIEITEFNKHNMCEKHHKQQEEILKKKQFERLCKWY